VAVTREEHLLTILAEECAEVAQRASKAARFGLEEVQPGQPLNNKRRIEAELADLMGVGAMLGLIVRRDEICAKRDKVEKFLELSRQMGTLDENKKEEA
jgi:NTP pyrophosphatase (non-canonical NTP hydrolase)